MSKYDKAPEAAEADLVRASDAVSKADDDLDDAIERSEQAERDADAAENAEDEAAALRRHEEIQREIEGLRQDLSSAEAHLQSTTKYWGLS